MKKFFSATSTVIFICLFLFILNSGYAFPQSNVREPSAGYVYPAGGMRGSSFTLTVGGQYLRGVNGAHFSCGDIKATSFAFVPPLNVQQRSELQKRIREINRARRLSENPSRDMGNTPLVPGSDDFTKQETTLPPHPLLMNLENLEPYQLQQVAEMFLPHRRLQISRAIQEMVIIDIEVSDNAVLGKRELRLITPRGMTNPLRFYVGVSPEIIEREPNDPSFHPSEALELPIVINGQIMPGDSDLFRFKANKGDKLVIEAYARRIIPYIADGVPGWFQPVLILYDDDGRELAYSDGFRYSHDPVIMYEITKDGEYIIEIRDSIYRGREDFVYRLHIGETPFITNIFPLGGRTETAARAVLQGWNLERDYINLDTKADLGPIRYLDLWSSKGHAGSITYHVQPFPEIFEQEPNNSIPYAQSLALPVLINGIISEPGDSDVFKFHAKSGEKIVAEVFARRLGSPLDSILRLTDVSGRVLQWNDDTEDAFMGMHTHHADSYMNFTVIQDGTYFIHISDVQGQGESHYAYRLRISRENPDFSVKITPSTVNISGGASVPLLVHVFRRDGFDGDIRLSLKEMPEGFAIGGGVVPSGKDRIWITLTAPERRFPEPVHIEIEGHSFVEGELITRKALPADEMMQAFFYTHLVEAEKLVAMVRGPRRQLPVMVFPESMKVEIPYGETVELEAVFKGGTDFIFESIRLVEPAEDFFIQSAYMEENILKFVIGASSRLEKPDVSGNLIFEVFATVPFGRPDSEGVRPVRNISLGVLPAVQYVITGF